MEVCLNPFRKVLKGKEAAAHKVKRAKGDLVLRSHCLTSASMTTWLPWRSPSVSPVASQIRGLYQYPGADDWTQKTRVSTESRFLLLCSVQVEGGAVVGASSLCGHAEGAAATGWQTVYHSTVYFRGVRRHECGRHPPGVGHYFEGERLGDAR